MTFHPTNASSHAPPAPLHVRHDLPHQCHHWRDFYPPPTPPPSQILPKPNDGIRYYSTKWKLANPNPKSAEGRKAFYGSMYPGMMGGYPGMMGMYPGMMGGMGGMMPVMGYGMPRYGMGPMVPPMGYGGYGMGGYGMDPYMGAYGAPPAAMVVDDFPDAHRIEHAYRQSMPDSYGVGMGMMGGLGGGMGVNNMMGNQVLLYGRGMPGGGWYY